VSERSPLPFTRATEARTTRATKAFTRATEALTTCATKAFTCATKALTTRATQALSATQAFTRATQALSATQAFTRAAQALSATQAFIRATQALSATQAFTRATQALSATQAFIRATQALSATQAFTRALLAHTTRALLAHTTRALLAHTTRALLAAHTTRTLHRGLNGMAAITLVLKAVGPWIPSQGCVRVTWCAHALTQSASLISTSLFLSRVSARDRRGRLVRSCRRTPGHSGSSQSRVQSATPCAARIRCGCVVSWHATAAAESDRAMRLLVPSGCGGGASARVLAVLLPKSSWVFGGWRHDAIGHSDTLLQPCSWSRHVCKPAQQLCVCLCSSHRAVPARRYKQ
jgi:hypothetical protein